MEGLQALEQAAAAATDPAARVRALNALSSELARIGRGPRALELAEQASALAAGIGDAQLDAQTRHALARCHFYLADFMPALDGLLHAARLYQQVGDLAGAATALAGVGMCQHRLGAHNDAVASLLQALETSRALALQALEINILNALGSALIVAERPDEAARHLADGLERAQASGDRNQLTKLLMNQALLIKQRGDACDDADAARTQYALALEQVQRGLALARGLGNAYAEAHGLGECGTLLRLLGRHDEAAQSLNDALALARAQNERHVTAEALMELARVHLAGGDAARARELLTEAVRLAREIAARPVLAQACQALSQLYEQAGEFQAALALYKEHHAVHQAELADSRKHAAAAAQLWLDFQEASRRASQYRERAETLEADHAALTNRARALMEASEQDPLTGLLNRRGLDARIDALFGAGDRLDTPLVVALIDVDRFKQINDTHSHAVGDAVLGQLGALIRAHSRQDDLPVRYGGDEFLLVLAGADLATGTRVLERLQQATSAFDWTSRSPGLAVTMSIGVAARERGAGFATTLALADQALYEAKKAGRHCITIAPRGAPPATG